MKTGILLTAAGAVALFGAPIAAAEDADTTVTQIGGQAELADGSVVQAWTVSGLSAHDGSSDAVRTDQNVAVAFAA